MQNRPHKEFSTQLMSDKIKWDGGYAGGPGVKLVEWADQVYGGEVSGAWLCCYMLRRFGWPNEGSDPYKNLCTWTLTTPIAGLWLAVTPYLGNSNLHFAVRFTKKVGEELEHDTQWERFRARKQRVVDNWWTRIGSKKYTWGCGTPDDEDKLVLEISKDDKGGKIYGLWERTVKHTWPNKFPKDPWICGHISEFLEKNHPEVRLPKWKPCKRTDTRFQIRVKHALKLVMRDLLKPTNVRDISFTPCGDIERTPKAVKRYTNQDSAGYFDGAGHTPSYWFSNQRRKDEAKQKLKNS